MEQKIKILPGRPYPMGVSLLENGNLNFAAALHGREECGLVLYTGRKEKKIVFRQEDRRGNMYCVQIQGIRPEEFSYHFFEGERRFVDPYAKALAGNEIWGAQNAGRLKGRLPAPEYDWEGDRPLMTPYEDSIFYLLHVRGFTKHSSSGVRDRGTFAGLIQKLPYLLELGITAVELMPCYEFLEREKASSFQPRTQQEAAAHAGDPVRENGKEPPINYWGYKKGYYLAPKSSYSAGKDACRECRDMVKAFHRAGIEVILQFYFPREIKQAYILEVIKYWVCTYHIDGVHLLGERIPAELLATEPMLENTKLIHHEFDCEEIYGTAAPEYRNLAVARDHFLYDCRHFLKGDAGMLQAFLRHMKENPQQTGIINYMTNYNGFTLADLVSYDRKHNTANEEDNRDGAEDNVSWNCGTEGKTRKKSILRLRRKQQKNALLFEMLAQGTPMLLAGDEFGRTQNGNNNAYCQDNETGWVNWSLLERNRELFCFTKELIALRRAHPILRRPEEMRQMDYVACGYPDVSYHGREAWRLKWEEESRQAGILYCGSYAKKNKTEDDDFFYLAYNMHWEPYAFALPELPQDRSWVKCLSTAGESSSTDMMPAGERERAVSGATKPLPAEEGAAGEREYAASGAIKPLPAEEGAAAGAERAAGGAVKRISAEGTAAGAAGAERAASGVAGAEHAANGDTGAERAANGVAEREKPAGAAGKVPDKMGSAAYALPEACKRERAVSVLQESVPQRSVTVEPRSVTVMAGIRRPGQEAGRKKEGSFRKRYEDMAAF